ncbi:MAG TPA: acylphosphatase [Dehalococcoidales bacterium]|nr:acylphosphatase [Dehalococcoidales bacterium]
MADQASLQATVRGRVQGVFFRAFVRQCAGELKLAGYTYNRPDGSVEVRAEGERESLEKLVSYLWSGPPASRVTGVTTSYGEYSGQYTGFRVDY